MLDNGYTRDDAKSVNDLIHTGLKQFRKWTHSLAPFLTVSP